MLGLKPRQNSANSTKAAEVANPSISLPVEESLDKDSVLSSGAALKNNSRDPAINKSYLEALRHLKYPIIAVVLVVLGLTISSLLKEDIKSGNSSSRSNSAQLNADLGNAISNSSDDTTLQINLDTLVKNSKNSSNTFLVQNASGESLFRVNGANAQIEVNGLLSVNGDILSNGTIVLGGGSSLNSEGLRINNILVCNATGCIPSPAASGTVDLSNINAGNITSGTLSDGRLSGFVTLQGNIFNGPNQLVKLDGSGQLPPGVVSGSIAQLNANQTFNGDNIFSSASNSFTGNGAGLTSLNATNVSSGTLNDARLSANVTLQGNIFNGINQLVRLDASGNLPALNASALTSLDATNISSGTLSDLRLSANVSLLGSSIDSSEITNDSITDSDINSAAGISWSKISKTGSSLADLATRSATDLSSGTLADGRLSSNVALLNSANTFTNTNLIRLNSAAAFQVQNASSEGVFAINTTGNSVVLGTSGALNGTLVFNSATSPANVTIQPDSSLANAYTLLLPALASGTYAICTDSGNCNGAGATLQTSYNNSSTPEITVDGTRGALTIRDNATPIAANLFEVQSNAGATKYLAVDATGISVAGNVNITGQYQVGGSQISSANLSNDANLTKLDANQTFTGENTFSNANNSFTGDGSGLTDVDAATLSSLTAGNFVQLAQGVQTDASTTNPSIGINKTGGTADILQLQKSGADVLRIDNNGYAYLTPTSLIANNSVGFTQTYTTANATASGVQVGQYISIDNSSNSVATSNTAGLYVLVNDNGSVANRNTGITVLLAGSNSAQIQIGIDTAVARGAGTISTSTGVAGNSYLCAGTSTTMAVGTCSGSIVATGVSATGSYSRTSGASSGTINDNAGNAVYGVATGTANAGQFKTGVKGITDSNGGTNAYTSTGVYGEAAGNANATIYGGYFTFNSSAAATNGAALYASNNSSTAKIFQLQDGSTDVMAIADGGTVNFKNQTNSATAFVIQNATAADTLFTVNTDTRANGGNIVKIGNSTGTDTDTTILVLDGSTANPTTNLSALNGGLFYNSTSHKLSIVENGAVKVLCNQTDASCGGNSTTLQEAYDASTGGSTPEIVLGATRTTLDIQDRSTTNGGTLGTNLLAIRSTAANDSTLGAALLTVNGTGQTLFQNSTNSTTAFQVQNTAGSTAFNVDTTNTRVGIGTTAPTDLFSVSPVYYSTGTAGTGGLSDTTVTGSGTTWTTTMIGMEIVFSNGSKGNITDVPDPATIILDNPVTVPDGSSYGIHNRAFYVTNTGSAGLRSSTNSTTAFQVQNASGTALFSVDTNSSTLNSTGFVNLQPVASLTSGQTHITQTLANASSTGGTVNGYSQTITVANTSSASTTNGINIAVTDATTLTNTTNGINLAITDNGASGVKTNTGLKVTMSGSNTSQIQYGIDVSASRGIGIRSTSSGGATVTCGGTSVAATIGICAGATGSGTKYGLYANADISSAGAVGFFNATNSCISCSTIIARNTIQGNILELQGGTNATTVFEVNDFGLITINPTNDSGSPNLVASQTHVNQNFTNASSTSSHTVTGYNQTVTVSNTSAGTTKGLNVSFTDNVSAQSNTNIGLDVDLQGTNTSQTQYAVDLSANRGTGIRAASTGTGSLTDCGGFLGTYSIGVCGTSSSATSGYGGYFKVTGSSAGSALYASNGSTTSNIFRLEDNTTGVLTISNGGAALFQNQTDSATAFQIQQAGAGSVIFAADTSNLVIKVSGNTTTFATLHIDNAHFKSTQTNAPTSSVSLCGSGGEGATLISGSTDSAGTLTVTTGSSGIITSCSATITFNKSYGAAPKSILITSTMAVGTPTTNVQAYVSAATTSSFTLSLPGVVNSDEVSFYYWVIE